MTSIYDFSLENRMGEIPLLTTKVVLIVVNTATGCGLTPPCKDFKSLYQLPGERA